MVGVSSPWLQAGHTGPWGRPVGHGPSQPLLWPATVRPATSLTSGGWRAHREEGPADAAPSWRDADGCSD